MEDVINLAWEKRNDIVDKDDIEELKSYLSHIFKALDQGILRVAEQKEDRWLVNTWIKKAILLTFKFHDNKLQNADSQLKYYDKLPLKFENCDQENFTKLGVRVVPGAVVRYGAYIAPRVVLMPSFVNVGAYIGEGSLIDTWSTIGSCAQIGKHCHISGGVGVGGVLEPLQATPVIIEDNVFIGARSEIAEGVIVEEGAVISMGVFLGASTKIYDRQTQEIIYGRVPKYSVVVPGSLPMQDGKSNTYAAIIVKKVDEKTREKTSINELLRV